MDKHTPEQRHRNMKAVKNKGSRIETMLCKELWRRGLRYRKNYTKVYGKPDIVFVGKKVAIFCDSEFWHGFNWEERKNDIKSRREFWIPKIERNIDRDKEVTGALTQAGWVVLRFWGTDIKKNMTACVEEVKKAISLLKVDSCEIEFVKGGGVR